jgi:hypothetical protein
MNTALRGRPRLAQGLLAVSDAGSSIDFGQPHSSIVALMLSDGRFHQSGSGQRVGLREPVSTCCVRSLRDWHDSSVMIVPADDS